MAAVVESLLTFVGHEVQQVINFNGSASKYQILSLSFRVVLTCVIALCPIKQEDCVIKGHIFI